MDERILEIARTFIRTSQEIVKDGNVSPPVVAFLTKTGEGEDGKPRYEANLVELDFSDDRQKHAYTYAVNVMAIRKGCAAVVFVSECWMAAGDDGRRPQDRPDRKEIIMAAVSAPSGLVGFYCDILRKEGGVAFGEIKRVDKIAGQIDPWKEIRKAN